MNSFIVDSHCHLDFPELAGQLQGVLSRMAGNGVRYGLCISVNLSGFPDVLALAEKHDNLYATVGIHPDQHPGHPGTHADIETLCSLAGHERILAIGETGLDYHWHRDAPEWQRERFRVHIRAARLARKPLVIHTREAAHDTLAIMEAEGAGQVGGVMHCFTESAAVADAALSLGFYISFSGIITFRNAAALRDVVSAVPLDRMLVETDSPFLAPVPHRGKINEPAFALHVVEEISRIKGLDVDEVASATSRNFERLFGVMLGLSE